MRKLSKPTLEAAIQWLLNSGRELEQSLVKRSFLDGKVQEVINALAKYQNEDGGFGHGLEADIQMPVSSPISTTVAMQHLIQIDHLPEADEMITKAIRYFENTYDDKRNGWYAVPETVNQYPHAFWWTVHEDGMTWIDNHWGNPSAEIIGYLIHYSSKLEILDVEKLVDHAIKHLISLDEFQSEHEIYCYLRFFRLLPNHLTEEIHSQLIKAIQSLVQTDETKWEEYVPSPLKFIPSPEAQTFGIPIKDINKNLDYIIGKLESEGKLVPNWSWNEYLDDWEKAKQQWTGVLTLEALEILKRFGRI